MIVRVANGTLLEVFVNFPSDEGAYRRALPYRQSAKSQMEYLLGKV